MHYFFHYDKRHNYYDGECLKRPKLPLWYRHPAPPTRAVREAGYVHVCGERKHNILHNFRGIVKNYMQGKINPKCYFGFLLSVFSSSVKQLTQVQAQTALSHRVHWARQCD